LREYWINGIVSQMKPMPNGNCEPQTWQLGPLGDFSILEHERLKNPTEMLPILLQRFVDQKDEFQE